MPTKRSRKLAVTTKIAGVAVTAVPFFDSLDVKVETIETYCPFCEAMVKAKKKSYLMVCEKCGQRID